MITTRLSIVLAVILGAGSALLMHHILHPPAPPIAQPPFNTYWP